MKRRDFLKTIMIGASSAPLMASGLINTDDCVKSITSNRDIDKIPNESFFLHNQINTVEQKIAKSLGINVSEFLNGNSCASNLSKTSIIGG